MEKRKIIIDEEKLILYVLQKHKKKQHGYKISSVMTKSFSKD